MAYPVGGRAVLEVANTVVLTSESDEIRDGRVIAALDIGAEELAALGEAEGVDGWCRGEDRVGGEVCADIFELGGEVADERGGAVGGGVIVNPDVVDECAWVYFLGEVAD